MKNVNIYSIIFAFFFIKIYRLKMLKYFVIYTFVFCAFVVPAQIGLTNRDLCVRKNKVQHEMICGDQFSYECGSNKCAISKQACSYFKMLNFTLRSFKNLINQKSELEKFEKFAKKISECPDLKPKWLPIHVCYRTHPRGCEVKRIHNFLLKLNHIEKCWCPKNYSYLCEREICSTNQKECLMFKKKKASVNKLMVCQFK